MVTRNRAASSTRKTAAQKAAETKAVTPEATSTPPTTPESVDGTAGATPPADATTLDNDTTQPSTTAPGDGPADTTDPSERAVSVPPAPGAEAIAVGTVNAVVPAPTVPAAASKKADKPKPRIEKFEATRPDGSVVVVTRNIETGESTIAD
jgi:hypothetical protein